MIYQKLNSRSGMATNTSQSLNQTRGYMWFNTPPEPRAGIVLQLTQSCSSRRITPIRSLSRLAEELTD